MGFLCLHSKKDMRKVACLPLAGFTLLVSAVLTGYQIWRLIDLYRSPDWGSWSGYISLVLGILQLLIVLLAFASILARWAKGVTFLVLGFKLILLIFVFSFISMWVAWIMSLGGWGADKEKWKPTTREWVSVGVITAIHIIFFIFAWVVVSAVHSLKNVIAVGGTGWEFKSYKDIRTGNLGGGKSRSSTSDDSV